MKRFIWLTVQPYANRDKIDVPLVSVDHIVMIQDNTDLKNYHRAKSQVVLSTGVMMHVVESPDNLEIQLMGGCSARPTVNVV